MLWLWVTVVLILPFLLVVFTGAPYLPTKKAQIEQMFDELQLKQGSLVVDLGSGDGVLLQMAAERGYQAIGYELNPYLVMLSIWRTRHHRNKVKIVWGSFWQVKLPKETELVFVFLTGPLMSRLDKLLTTQAEAQPFLLASVGFKVPGRKHLKQSQAVYLYNYK